MNEGELSQTMLGNYCYNNFEKTSFHPNNNEDRDVRALSPVTRSL